MSRDSINMTEESINLLLKGYDDIVLSEGETKEFIRTLNFSNIEHKGLFKGLKHLFKVINEKHSSVIWFNNDFREDSYTTKLLFKELFFWEGLRAFSFRKLKARIKNNERFS